LTAGFFVRNFPDFSLIGHQEFVGDTDPLIPGRDGPDAFFIPCAGCESGTLNMLWAGGKTNPPAHNR
jgi:hypothetical protein